MNGEERFGKLKYGTQAAERRKEEDDNRNVTRKILVPTSKRGENGLTVKKSKSQFPQQQIPRWKENPFGAGNRGVRSQPPNQDAHKLILRSIFQRGNAIKKGEGRISSNTARTFISPTN